MDHLPECPAPLCDYFDPKGKCMGYEDCEHLCCCAALRACEQRVLNASTAPPWLCTACWYRQDRHSCERTERCMCRDCNYGAGLDAAREAVAAADPYWSVETDENDTVFVMEISSALAAIDALKEKP